MTITSKLDYPQIIQSVYDEYDNTLRIKNSSIIGSINFNKIEMSYTSTTDVYVYMLDGVIQATITTTYTDGTKNIISMIERT